ncbi:tyrosine-type recombinase/integrase [Gordonibacter sp.]|uniref:tyrosine-type recombinase/integrase n=1 Tax=Gordonibacter sp. TaxID=1968902 RepID=UPI002FC729F6
MMFSDICASYIAEKRAVGCKYEKAERITQRVVALHDELGCAQDELPREFVEAWTAKKPGEAETTRLNRIGQIRGLADYMARMGYVAYVIPGKQGYVEKDSYAPYIFTDDELAALFTAADELANFDDVSRHSQLALILQLLYSTGLRCGEACALRKDDVNFDEGILTIRHAKNDKDRLVPVCSSVLGKMLSFANAAALRHPQYMDHNLFWSLPEGAPITTQSVYVFFRKALWRAGISHGGRGKGPRVHDLRFTFACHRLRAWVSQGVDVNALLPVLAAYMGHADTRCTEYYLKLTAELYPGMIAQVEKECGWMVPL